MDATQYSCVNTKESQDDEVPTKCFRSLSVSCLTPAIKNILKTYYFRLEFDLLG